VIPPELFFWLSIDLALTSLLCFQMNFREEFSISLVNVIGIFMGIVLIMYIAFSSIAIFTVLIVPIHEHGKSFHLL
jgi:hypothetical protein